MRVAFASNDRADDGLASGTHHVAEHLGELDVHFDQRLLHALYPVALLSAEDLALPCHGAHHAHLAVGAEGTAQQAQTHELLQPLAVLHVALAPGHVLHLACIDQEHLQSALLQHLVHRNPVDARRFQRHRVDPTLNEPVGQCVQVAGHHAELAHRLICTPRRHRHPVTRPSHIDRRRVGKYFFSLAHCHGLPHHR
jgi:hypothetical protein